MCEVEGKWVRQNTMSSIGADMANMSWIFVCHISIYNRSSLTVGTKMKILEKVWMKTKKKISQGLKLKFANFIGTKNIFEPFFISLIHEFSFYVSLNQKSFMEQKQYTKKDVMLANGHLSSTLQVKDSLVRSNLRPMLVHLQKLLKSP